MYERGARLQLALPLGVLGCRGLFGDEPDNGSTEPGLLSKIIAAFIRESDESPYRFWLASCIESYLRGSSPQEQIFVARSGLLDHFDLLPSGHRKIW